MAAEIIGLAAALLPQARIGIFSHQADVVQVGVDYLHRVAPVYAFYGMGMAFYFASQGAGRVVWPLIAGLTRLVLVVAGGWYWVSVHGGGLAGLFAIIAIIAVSHVAFGAINLLAFGAGGSWSNEKRSCE